MTEMTFDQAEALGYDGTQRTANVAGADNVRPEVYGVYLDNQPVNVVRENDHTRIVSLKDDRIVALVNLNEGKAETIRQKNEEIEAMKRQAGELVDQRERMAQEAEGLRGEIERAQRSEGIEVSKAASIRNEIRDGIIQFADEHDLDREFVNGLLEGYLDMKPLPEYVEATVMIEVTARFRAGSGAHSNLSEWYVENNVDFDVSVDPHYSSGLDFEEITHSSVDVRTVETN